jgi:hypothetical protein
MPAGSVSQPLLPRPSSLADLPDGCLLLIFRHLTPLPDLFQVSSTCWVRFALCAAQQDCRRTYSVGEACATHKPRPPLCILQRFHRLVTDRRMWLVVAPTHIPPEATPSGRAGPVYKTLAAAVAASRPGDTVWLAPGVEHEARDVRVPHPLHILCGGRRCEDTKLCAPLGADCAIAFWASAKLAAVSVNATRCPCVVHAAGLLTLERCSLVADALGLSHLVSPVRTLAAAAAANTTHKPPGPTWAPWPSSDRRQPTHPEHGVGDSSGEDSSSVGAGLERQHLHHHKHQQQPLPLLPEQQQQHQQQQQPSQPQPSQQQSQHLLSLLYSGYERAQPPRTMVAGMGRLRVVECRLHGGGAAVECRGTGRLRDVRVIYDNADAPLSWLEVDSADPGVSVPPALPQVLLAPLRMRQGHACDAHVLTSKVCEWQATRLRSGSSGGIHAASHGNADALAGLARIHAALGSKRISPAMLSAHLGSNTRHRGEGRQCDGGGN